jgi:ClpP class serine protease
VSDATVRDGYGQGRLLGAEDALAAGMVDSIGTLDDVIGELATHAGAAASAIRSTQATRQEPRIAATRQEPLDDWHRRVALDLRLLDL